MIRVFLCCSKCCFFFQVFLNNGLIDEFNNSVISFLETFLILCAYVQNVIRSFSWMSAQ